MTGPGKGIVPAPAGSVPGVLLADMAKPIRERWQAAVSAIVQTGELLIEARKHLQHGEFQEMVEKNLPFSTRTANKLMAIAHHEWLANRTHESLLPPAWTTLYELSRLPTAELEKAKGAGLINAEMERADVKILTRPPRPQLAQIPPIQEAGEGHRLMLADPSWDWETWSDRGQTKSPSMHYPPMSAQEIMRLPVMDLMADDGVCVLWVTWPHLQLGHTTMEAWGFRYITGGAWFKASRSGEKQAFGMGHVLRNACDPFLVGTVGRPRTNGTRLRNALDGAAVDGEPFLEVIDGAVVDGAIREHSRKPDSIYDLCEALVPGGPFVELFARQRRPGWTFWGTETDRFEHTGGWQ